MSAIVFNYGKGNSTSFGSRAAMRIFVIKLITFVGGKFVKFIHETLEKLNNTKD